ncbi:MAG TPA: secretin N-terminal domain-containing protein [Phycisphaerae bacterium]|nr:secretin N-terminal domain-containing protein [Phycisphaerae bacterium]
MALRFALRKMCCVLIVVGGLWASPRGTLAAGDETSDEILAKIQKLADQEVTEAQIRELDELWVEWEKAMEREGREDEKRAKALEALSGFKEQPTPAAKEPKKETPQQARRVTPAPRTPKPEVDKNKDPKDAVESRNPSSSRHSSRRTPTSRRGSSNDKKDDDDKAETKKPRTSGRRHGRANSSRGRDAAKNKPSKTGVELRPELNVDAENYLKPYDQRTYQFSIDGTYADLMESFSRMSGLPIVGEAPAGDIKFVSSEKMDFKTAMGRISMLLFRHPDDMYWIYLDKTGSSPVLQLIPVNYGVRPLPLERIFPTVEEYRASGLGDNEMAMLVYTPETGSVAELEPLRDFMPDYVRIAQVPDKNQMNIFGLVRDINKYLQLIDRITPEVPDPREIRILKIEHILPSEAVESLRLLVDGFDEPKGAPARKRRGNQASVAEAEARGIVAIPNDDMSTLLLYAMPKKIEEVKKVLPFVDVDPNEPDYAPVIVEVKYGKSADVLTMVQTMLSTDVSTTPNPNNKKKSTRGAKKKPRPRRAATGSTASLDELTMIDWPAMNSIIMKGTDEKIEEARALIERFDVPDATVTEFVDVEHRDPVEFVALINEIFSSQQEDGVTCTVDNEGESIVLIGKEESVAKARDLIAQLDVESEDEADDVFSYRLQNTTPSSLIAILTQWDSESPTAASTAAKGSKRRTRRRATTKTNRFQADDASNTLYVFCNQSEWDEKYRPMIVKLDNELNVQTEYDVITLNYLNTSDAISILESKFDGTQGGGAPSFLESPQGIMVFDASDTQLAIMKHILAAVDVDPVKVGALIRKTFTLEFVAADELIPMLEAMVDTGSISAPAPKTRGKRKPKTTAPASTSSVQFVDFGNRLYVTAPPQKMVMIEELIKELDTNPDETAIRAYDFEPGTNVVELSQTLSQFFPKNSRIVSSLSPAKPTDKRRRSTKPVTKVASRGDSEIMFVPQPATRKIFISAPVDMFDEIEDAIEMLRPDVEGPNFAVEFIEVDQCDPTVIVDVVAPIIELRKKSYILSGELPETTEKDADISLTADPAANRIVYAGPRLLIDDLKTLITEVQKGQCNDDVVRRVPLIKSPADEMALAINAMLTGSPAPGAITQTKGGKDAKRGGNKSKTVLKTTGVVTVVAAPGGDALVVKGPSDEVDRVEAWIRKLDDDASMGLQMKIYKLTTKDVEEFADEIMTVIDSGSAKAKKSSEDSMWDDISFGGPRRGGNISLVTNYFANVMIVWASPQDLAKIDALFDVYESGEVDVVEEMPSELVELKHVDPFDATYTLEELIDALWSKNAPKVDYIPLSQMLVIKSRNMDEDLPRIKKLIADFVDIPGKEGEIKHSVASIKGKPVSVVTALLLEQLGDMDIEVEGLSSDKQGSRLKVLKPESDDSRCVLPSSIFAGLEALQTSAFGQTAPNEDEPAADPDDALKSVMEDERASKSDDGEADDSKTESTRPKVRIIVDEVTNSIRIEGAPKDVSEVKYAIEQIEKDIEKLPQLPDIRVWQLQHVDPNVAAQVLESMFNASNRSAAQAAAAARANPRNQAAQMNKQLANMQAAMNKQMKELAKQNDAGGGESDGKDERRRGKEGEDEEDEDGEKGTTPGGISVFPYPALNAIIIKAPTELYPAIEELVATIDRKGDSDSGYKFFKITNQLASDVETQLKQIFGLDQQQQSRRPNTRQPRGRNQNNNNAAAAAAADQMREAMALSALVGADGGMISSTETITIASNDVTNTIMVRAPKRILEVAEEIIQKIEEQAPEHIETREYRLAHADAESVVTLLDQLYDSGSGNLSEYHPDNVEAIFKADVANNTVYVRAKVSAFEKIDEAIAKLDVKQDIGNLLTIDVLNGDAEAIAATLEAIYGVGKGKGRSKSANAQIEFIADSASSKIFVRAPESLHAEIQGRVAEIDVPQTGLDIKVFKLKYANAPQVLNQMNTMVNKLLQQLRATKANIKLDPFSAEADQRSNSLVVMGGPITFAFVSRVLAEIDVEAAAPMEIQTKVIALNDSDSREIAATINRLYGGPQPDGLDPPRAEANVSTNTVIVRGTAGQLDKIDAEVIKKLDEFASGPSAPVKKIYQIKEARASNVADVINRSLRGGGRGSNNNISVVPDDEQNVLVIYCTQKDYDELVPLIEELDKKPDTQSEVVVRVYQIEYVEPNSAVRAIQDTFKVPRGAKPQDEVKVNYVSGTSSLVVSATPENHLKVAELITNVDTESPVQRTTHVIGLKDANAEELAGKLSQIMERTRRRRRDDQGFAIVADPGTNSLLVFANESELADIKGLIETLDVPQQFEQQVKSFNLEFADAGSTTQALTQLFGQGRSNRRASPRDQIKVVPAWGSNAVVVAGSPQHIQEIEAFLKDYDQKGTGSRDVKVVQIKYANASEVARALQDIFVNRGRNVRGQETISVTAPSGSDAILIKASDDEFAEITKVIEQLDVLPDDTDRSVRTFTLEYTNADEMQTIIEDYLRKPGNGGGRRGRGGGEELLGNIRVSIVSSNNSLVVTGDEDGLARVASLIEKIDVETEAESGPQIIKLERAIASEVEPTLSQIFVEGANRNSGRNRNRGGGSTMTPVIVANDVTNSLIVRANPGDFAQIERLAHELDSEEAEGERVKLIQLSSAFRADDIASTLEATLAAAMQPRGQAGGGSRRGGRGGRNSGSLSVEPISSSNSLLIAGDPKELELAEVIVAQIQQQGPAGGRKTLILTPDKMDPEDFKRVIEGMIEQNNSQGSRRSSRRGRRR